MDGSKYTLGVDLSHHNNFTVDVDFIIHKASEGKTYVDKDMIPKFNKYMYTNMILGAYHFCRADNNNSYVSEADNFMNAIMPFLDKISIVALDIEASSLNVKNIDEWAYSWCDYVMAHTGRKPFLYISESQIRKFPKTLSRFPLWVAKYSLTKQPTGNYKMWQLTSNPFDIDVFLGNREDLKNGKY